MKGVTPLKKETKDIHTEKTLKTVKKNKKIIQKTNFLETNKPIDKTTPTQYKISFGEINKELKKGKVKIDRKIDLHGYSLSKAYEILKKEIKNTYEKNKRCILVVTGKGLHLNKDSEEEKPKLFHGKIKNSIVAWINDESIKNYVLTYQDAGFENGGDGAIFIYLRKKKI